MTNVHQERPKRPNVASQKLPVAMNHCYCRRGAKQSERIKRLLKNVKNDTRTSKTSIIGIQSYAEKMIRVSNHLLSIVFRFFHSQKLIGSLGIVDNKLIFVSVLKVFCLLDRFSHTLKTTALSFRSPDYIRDASTFVGHVAHLIRGYILANHGQTHQDFTDQLTRRYHLELPPHPVTVKSSPGLWTILSRESQPKPSFLTGILGGGQTPQGINSHSKMCHTKSYLSTVSSQLGCPAWLRVCTAIIDSSYIYMLKEVFLGHVKRDLWRLYHHRYPNRILYLKELHWCKLTKLKMEPENDEFQDKSPCPRAQFQAQFSTSGVVWLLCKRRTCSNQMNSILPLKSWEKSWLFNFCTLSAWSSNSKVNQLNKHPTIIQRPESTTIGIDRGLLQGQLDSIIWSLQCFTHPRSGASRLSWFRFLKAGLLWNKPEIFPYYSLPFLGLMSCLLWGRPSFPFSHTGKKLYHHPHRIPSTTTLRCSGILTLFGSVRFLLNTK